MAAARGKRDVTRALILVALLRREFENAKVISGEQSRVDNDFDELEELLQGMDARTGRRDPSKRAVST